MRTETQLLIALAAVGVALVADLGCKGPGGCAKDADCKGDRICVDGACQESQVKPDTATQAAKTASATAGAAISTASTATVSASVAEDRGPIAVPLPPNGIEIAGLEPPKKASAVPKPNDWSEAPLLAFPAAADAGCEAKLVREWFQITCLTKKSPPGEPFVPQVKKVKPARNCAASVYLFDRSYPAYSIASLLVRLTPNLSCTADVMWDDMTRRLEVSWPADHPVVRLSGG